MLLLLFVGVCRAGVPARTAPAGVPATQAAAAPAAPSMFAGVRFFSLSLSFTQEMN